MPTDEWTDRRTTGQTVGHTDERIILPLKGFEPVVCGSMRRAQLRAVRMIAKK